MSSLALMRWLESAPARYDRGMRLITLGRVDLLYDAVAEAVAAPGIESVLEIGCGTGAVTTRLVATGARVTAVDQNPEMLERARVRLQGVGPGSVTWLERTAAEIDSLEADAYDAVVASLCLSEMSLGERAFVLRAAARLLHAGGRLVLADEVAPVSAHKRLASALLRGPQVMLAWLLAGSISHPILDPAAEVRDAGLVVEKETRWLLDSLAVLIARKPR